MKRVKIGIVGRRGGAFVSSLKSRDDAELTALCELSPAVLTEQADRYEVPLRFTDFEQMLESVDAVVIATPMHVHAEQAVIALNAGKHVLSEVTAAVTLEECYAIKEAAESSDASYMFSENYCYIKSNVLIREMAGRGLFGELYYGEGEYLHEVRNLHHNADGSPTWRAKWQVGVNGCTYPTHSLGPVMQWFKAVDPTERIDSVICVGTGVHTDSGHPHDDTSLLLCKLKSGKLIRIRLDMMSNRPHLAAYYSLQGTQGSYEASRVPGQPDHIWVGESREGEDRKWRPVSEFEEFLPEIRRNPPEAALKAGHGGGDFFVANDFVDVCLGKIAPPIDIYDGLEWTAAGLCSQLSILNGGLSVPVPNFRTEPES